MHPAGLGNWTLSNVGVFSGWPTHDWAADSSLPGGRAGTGAFGVDPAAGNCDGGDGDVSGVVYMESQAIVIPPNITPKFAFDHYVASEATYDGGNVQVSVNGGAYALVPAAAYTFNAYNTTLTSAAGAIPTRWLDRRPSPAPTAVPSTAVGASRRLT